MSYEGYVQCLCKNGHYFEEDERYDFAEVRSEYGICGICNSEIIWTNHVDDTNCDQWGAIPFDEFKKNFLLTPEKRETCNLGHVHLSAATYRIPTMEETKKFQSRLDNEGEWELLSDVESKCAKYWTDVLEIPWNGE